MLSFAGSYTAPTYNNINFSLCSGYEVPLYNDINFTLGLDDDCVTDSCTCAGLDTNWEVDMADYCVITDACDLGTGELSFTGVGNFTCDAKIETTDMGDVGSGMTIYINGECRMIVE